MEFQIYIIFFANVKRENKVKVEVEPEVEVEHLR